MPETASTSSRSAIAAAENRRGDPSPGGIPMSALAVTDPTPARTTRQHATPTRLRPVTTLPPRDPSPRALPAHALSTLDLADVPIEVDADTLAGDEAVTLTVRVGAGEGARRSRVLQALRVLIDAAGPEVTAPPSVEADEQAVRIDPRPRTVQRGAETLTLSRLESDLLLFLAEHPRRVFSRNQLLNQVWGHDHTSARTVDVHVSRLRTKLGVTSDVITTVYGIGYRLADDAQVAVVR
jgi:hypothetical protein